MALRFLQGKQTRDIKRLANTRRMFVKSAPIDGIQNCSEVCKTTRVIFVVIYDAVVELS